MARPHIADGADGFHTWRVDTNISNKRSRQPTRAGYPAWRLDGEL